MRPLSLLVLIASASAFAQSEPPLVQSPPPLVQSPSYMQRCFAVPAQVWIPAPSGGGGYSAVNPRTSTATLSEIHAAQPVGTPSPPAAPATPAPSGGGSSGGGGIGSIGDGKALLVVAVVIVAVLPIIVYALDDDAPAVVEQRFHCPTFGFDLMGGVDLSDRIGSRASGTGRFTFGTGYFGSDFQFDLSNGSINAYAAHLLLRISPRAHIEPSLALGFRSMTLGARTRMGLEIGIPHRYVLWREGLRQFALELRPTFTVGPAGWDVGVEGALIIPIVEPVHLRAGGKVQSFGDTIVGSFNAGLTFTL